MRISDIVMAGVGVNILRYDKYPYGDVIRVSMTYKGLTVDEVTATSQWEDKKAYIIERCYLMLLDRFKEDLL